MQTKRKTLPKRFKGSSKKKSYGIGGAVMTLGKNLLQGKKFGDGMFKGVGKTLINPNPLSTVTSAIGLGGAFAGKSKNPAIQKIGEVADTVSNVGGMFTGGGGGAGFQNILQTLGKNGGGGNMRNILSGLIGNTSGADGMKVYASGGSIPHMKVQKSYHEGGQLPIHPHEANGDHPMQSYTDEESGETYDLDFTQRFANDREVSGGLRKIGDRGMTWDSNNPVPADFQEYGRSIGNPVLMNASNAEAGTVASYNTEPISADMSTEQFDLAMKSPFIAEQFGGQDIQNPQQLAEAYKGFTHKATLAIRENEPAVATAARELAETNPNFQIKMDKLAEDLGKEPTDKDIADMMVTMNTDGLFGDLHGAIVNDFLPSSRLNAYGISDGHFAGTAQMPAGREGRQINQWDVNGQTVTKGGQIFTSVNDMGINKREGLEKFFQEASDNGVDLTKNIKSTEEFMQAWFRSPENQEYIFRAKNVRAAANGEGDQDKSNPGQLIDMKQGEGIQVVNELTRGRQEFENQHAIAQGELTRLQQDWKYRKANRVAYDAELKAMQNEFDENFESKGAQARWIKSNYPDAIPAFNNPSWGFKDRAGNPIKYDEEGNPVKHSRASFANGGRVKILKAGGRIGALSGLFR